MIGRALRAQEVAGIDLLEAEVHLEPAVVGAAAVCPAALVAVDAEKRGQMRRPVRLPACPSGTRLPEPNGSLDVGNAHLGEHAACGRRPRDAHQPLPAPGGALVAVDLAAEPGDGCRALRLDCLCFLDYRSCLIPHSGLWGAGCARTACEQAGVGQDDTPQKHHPRGFACQS